MIYEYFCLGMLAVRTDTVVCQRAEHVLPAEPTKTDESTVKESADIQVMVLRKAMFMQL
jgi:hypothetical protein